MELNDRMYKETSREHLLSNFRSVTLELSTEALIWLMQSTTDNDGRSVLHLLLFYDLLCRMRTITGSDMTFRRPLNLAPGMLQFSEETLSNDWNIGRRRVRAILATMEGLHLIVCESSRVASSIALTGLRAWTEPSGNEVPNPSYRKAQGAESTRTE